MIELQLYESQAYNKFTELEQDKHTQALEILKLKERVKKLEKKKKSRSLGFKRLRKVGTFHRVESSTNTVVGTQEDASKQGEDRGCMMRKLKKLQPEISKKDDLERAQVLQKQYDDKEENIDWNVKYLIIDWEIHFEGSRTYWKIIRVGGITEAYQSFKDMLKGFDREDLVALWSLVKVKFSLAVPNVDKEKALWVKLKRLFKPDADDVLWKLQRYMHYPITWKLYTNCGVHQVSLTTRRHDMFMLTEKDYLLSNRVKTLMLSAKLEVEEESEMARDLVIKIFMEANKPKSRSLDTSSK
nr:hypothetical protein [Tanacetum cinerariifolium]